MEAFEKFVKQYDQENKKIILKYNHSYRVKNVAEYLAKKLNLSEHDIKLATIIGFTHDIGRFEQIAKFDTFTDFNSMDHGDYGAQLLFGEGLIKNFWDDASDYKIIRKCIEGHNKYALLECENDRMLTHLKIIRDADKIDIFNIFANLDELDLEFDGVVSSDIKEDFYQNKTARYESIKTNADSIVSHLSYIFDINFKESLLYIKEQRLIENFYNRTKENSELKEYFLYAKKYLEERVK